MKKILNLFFFSLVCTALHAGGYRVNLQGQRALAMGHTGVAVIDSAELAFFNPSGITFLNNKLNISVGVTAARTITKFQNLENRQAFETDNPIATPFHAYVTFMSRIK